MHPVSLLIFAKTPIAGHAKTRLIPHLGAEGAAALAKKLLFHTCTQMSVSNVDSIELWVTPNKQIPLWQTLGDSMECQVMEQQGYELGERLSYAARSGFKRSQSLIFVGTDCPSLEASIINRVIEDLHQYDSVMIPAMDGGYVLLAISQFDSSLFTDIPWSTEKVAERTLERMKALNWRCNLYPPLRDIDTAEDLASFQESDLLTLNRPYTEGKATLSY